MFKAALQRHGVRFGLPTLLQRFDSIDPQHRRGPEYFGLFNHRFPFGNAELLQRLKRCGGGANGGQPQRLNLRKIFLAQVAGFAPAVAELVQDAVETFPVVVQGCWIGRAPGVHLFDQSHAFSAVLHRLRLDFFQPRLNHFVGLVAGFVKTFPQAVVGHAALVSLFPLFAQSTQVFLHLAPAQLVARFAFKQGFSFVDQFFAQLINAPALPAFKLGGRPQGEVDLGFELVANQSAMLLERIAKGIGGAGAGFAVTFGHFKF